MADSGSQIRGSGVVFGPDLFDDVEAQMASVTILPVSRPEEGREHAATVAGQVGHADLVHPARPHTRPVRRRVAHPRPGGPRPVACDRSYEPDLHGSRLTGRGRVVVGLIWVLMALAVVAMISRPAGVPAPADTSTVVVEAGDTLWSLAEGLVPEGDRRVTITQIVELNGLSSAGDIHPGDVLVVPVE